MNTHARRAIANCKPVSLSSNVDAVSCSSFSHGNSSTFPRHSSPTSRNAERKEKPEKLLPLPRVTEVTPRNPFITSPQRSNNPSGSSNWTRTANSLFPLYSILSSTSLTCMNVVALLSPKEVKGTLSLQGCNVKLNNLKVSFHFALDLYEWCRGLGSHLFHFHIALTHLISHNLILALVTTSIRPHPTN